VSNPVPGPAGPGVPAGGTGTPRGEGDGIAVEVPTRAGLVTVVFTGREHARACPAGRAFTYRDRQYAGSVYLAGPDWQGTALLGLSLYPAGPAVAGAIASIIGAGVAAWLRDHPEILDLAAQARARAGRARARRDLELLTAEITAAGQHLDGLRRKQERLQAIASGSRDEPPGPAARTR